MRRLTILLGLFLVLAFVSDANAQNTESAFTNIIRLEIDGKEVKKDYKIFFRSGDDWIKARRASAGFAIPAELNDLDYLTVMIVFRGHKLEFQEIHRSKFTVDWVVGIDNKPFSDDIAWGIESDNAKRIYYIVFKIEPETIRLAIEKKK